MAADGEGTLVRLIRFIVLGVPTLSRVIAVALVVAAIALAFLEFGGYDEGTRADLALLLSALALVSLAIGLLVPWIVRRILPRR